MKEGNSGIANSKMALASRRCIERNGNCGVAGVPWMFIYLKVDRPALAFNMKLNSGFSYHYGSDCRFFLWIYPRFSLSFYPGCFCCPCCFVFLLFLTFCPRLVQITKFSFQKLPICTEIQFNLLPFSRGFCRDGRGC